MKERGILMSAPMVCATLARQKTQTRRVIPDDWWICLDPDDEQERANALKMCPHGVVGDRLWVRETWRTLERESDGVDGILYRADEAFIPIANTRAAAEAWVAANRRDGKWRPSIFMPRWASRITLEITEVRIEKVQDISSEDVLAEGVRIPFGERTLADGTTKREPYLRITGKYRPHEYSKLHPHKWAESEWLRVHFASLWDSINGKHAPWEDNDWVWVVSFAVVESATSSLERTVAA